MKDTFDPASAKLDNTPDEYSALLEKAALRALESEAVRTVLKAFEDRMAAMEKAHTEAMAALAEKGKALVDEVSADREAMKKDHAAIVATQKEHEKRIHQLASRPPPKDNTPAMAEAVKASTEAVCDAVCKSNAALISTIGAVLAKPEEGDMEEEDDAEEEATAPVAPKPPRQYRFQMEYDDHNRMTGVRALEVLANG